MKPTQRLDISSLEKTLRAIVIRDYMRRNNIARAVCFSCGNASKKLKEKGVKTLDISPRGDMNSRRWFTQEEITALYPMMFDATSGHLPLFLMREIADKLREKLATTIHEGVAYYIASGSGESAVCLKMAFPNADIIPHYDDNDPATEYSPNAPLNALVRAIFPVVLRTYKRDE